MSVIARYLKFAPVHWVRTYFDELCKSYPFVPEKESLIELMQDMLERTITRISDLEEKILEIKETPSAFLELRESKKLLAVQQRVKITLTQSIQELTPTSNALILPVKPSESFLTRIGNIFKSLFK
jgi:hypothetical protein